MKKTLIALLLCLGSLSAQAALDPAQVRQLAAEDSSDKVAAIRQLTQTADPDAVRILRAMAEDSLFVADDKVVIIDGEQAFDAATGAAIKMPANPESPTVNNRIRGELASALAALKLFDPEITVRLASARKLQSQVTPEMAPLLARAHAQANLGNATFSPELSDLTIYVIDVAAGEKIPRKGGPGITKSDLLVINKIDLAPMVGASLEVMAHDAKAQRGERPFVFSNLKTGQGLASIIEFIVERGML